MMQEKLTDYIIYFGSGLAVITLLIIIPLDVGNGLILLAFFEFCSVVILMVNAIIYRYYRDYKVASGIILLLLYVLLTYALFNSHSFQVLAWFYVLPVVTSFLLGYRKSRWANTLLFITFSFLVYSVKKHSSVNIELIPFIASFGLIIATSTLHEYMRFLAIEEANKLTITDSLTGAFNRRYFDQALRSAMQNSFRNPAPLCLIIFDIDYFKKINDRFGHKIGDEVLKNLVLLFSEHFRSNDKLFRIGGEEFGLVTNMPLENAKEMMKRFMVIISDRQTRENCKYTISVGITDLRKNDDEESFLHRADSEMYRAKNSGRNKICVSRSARGASL